MKKKAVFLALFLSVILTPLGFAQTTITFDDQGYSDVDDITSSLASGINGFKFVFSTNNPTDETQDISYDAEDGRLGSGAFVTEIGISIGTDQTITITKTDGSDFQFDSFWAQGYVDSNAGVKIEGFSNGVSTGSQTIGALRFGTPVTTNLNSSFDNVDEVRLTDEEGEYGFDALFDHFIFSDVISAPSTLTVNDDGDGDDATPGDGVCETGSGNGVCTLRAAVEEANVWTGVAITFASGINPLISSTTHITITTELSITGHGAGQTEINGDGNSRIFAITSDGVVTIEDVTLTNGKAPNGTSGQPGGHGGAITNVGILSITASTVSDNTAGNGDDGGPGGGGGAISNSGTLSISASTLSGNTAGGGGIGIGGGSGGQGGAIANSGSMDIINSILAGNTTGAGSSGPGGDGLRGPGGAIQNTGSGSSTITATTLANNTGRVGAAINQHDLDDGTLTLVNTLIAGNNDPEVDGRNCFATDPTNDLIDGGGNLDDGDTCGLGTGSLVDTDPVFADPDNDDYTLQAISPAINAGDNDAYEAAGGNLMGDLDLAGNPRLQHGTIDIGAYEFQGVPLSPVTSVELTAAEGTSGEGWRFLTSPVIGETYNGLLGGEEGLWTQGVDLDGARYSGGDPNVYLFDQSVFDWDAAFDLNEEIGPGNGFIIYVFADDDYDGPAEPEFPKTLTSEGNWLDRDETFEYTGLAYTEPDPVNPNPNINYYLLGNPHPVPLDFCEFAISRVAQSIDIWDPAENGGNGDYVNLNCANPLTDVHIAPFQAFWVLTLGSGPSLGIPEDAYLPGSVEGFFKQGKPSDRSERSDGSIVRLDVSDQQGTFTNTAHILLSEQASTGLDKWDGLKLSPAGLAPRWLSFYSMDAAGRAYAFQSLPQEEKISIPLDIQTTESGAFTLEWELPDQSAFAGNYFLRDNRSGKVMELREGGEYRFEMDNVAEKRPDRFSALTGSSSLQMANSSSTDKPVRSAPRFELLIAAAGVDGLAELGDLPGAFTLAQNYPNPFNPSTVIRYQLPTSSDVRLEVFDMLGRRVATLVEGQVAAGRHQVSFDASNLSSGVYLYRLQANGPNGANQIFTKKLTLIK